MAMQRQGRGFSGRNHGRAPIPDEILARMRRLGQPAVASPSHPHPPEHEYAFLVGTLVDRATLDEAEAEAAQCGATIHEVLLAAGRISQLDYAAVLARRLGVPVVAWDTDLDPGGAAHRSPAEAGMPAHIGGRPFRVLSATEATPATLFHHVAALQAQGTDVALAPQLLVDAALEAQTRPERLDRAVLGLLRAQPASSAGKKVATWQTIAGWGTIGLLIGGFTVLPDATLAALTALIALPFLCVTALRLVALRQAVASPASKARGGNPERVPDRLLPVYTVLVRVFREANVLPGLIQSLRALDYPPAKLEIFIVLETVDIETQAAVSRLALPGNFRSLVVPEGGPQTKPKALNYALQFARGDFVVVYDAEDRPQPGQLRRAWDVFSRSPPGLACLQAQLNIYNPRQSWFTRQFTIEYSALFDAILPALEKLRLPVPLGGTSNHFPRATLLEIGGWDPYNVTEDADLGVRIARLGYQTGVLASTTWEEAPPVFRVWLTQRTRWLKGWMQTYLVHTRQLRRLNRELGLRAAIGFHALMGGLIGSALVHPVFYVLLAYYWLSGTLLEPAESTAGTVLWAIALINLAFGYAVSILVGVISVWRRRRKDLAWSALTMPIYWLLISFAAYRALYQFARDPYLWEKTEHGMGPARRKTT
jgi:cellulose synthase/poly-beta-1,6-N-acetylglucosamine synthase-like glycosyltransferase